MVLAKLGVTYNPLLLLPCVFVAAVCTFVLFALQNPRNRSRHESAMQGEQQIVKNRFALWLALWSLILTLAIVAGFVRFQIDPLFIQGIFNQDSYHEFIILTAASAVLCAITLVLTLFAIIHARIRTSQS